MKKTVFTIAIILMILFPLTMQAQFSGGDGTSGNPYIITTAEQLAQLATYVNEGNVSNKKYYKLGNDIDLSAYQTGKGWIPIGNQNYSFRGSFDGDNHIVTNLFINAPDNDYSGLFGRITITSYDTLYVKNLGIEDVNIIGRNYVGGLVGSVFNSYSNTLISNCYTTGNVVSMGSAGGTPAVGGIVGRYTIYTPNNTAPESLKSGIVNCYSTVNVTGNPSSSCGGIVGNLSQGKITNCYATGSIISNGSVNGIIGGVIGVIGSTDYAVAVSSCAALNPKVGYHNSVGVMSGRVVGDYSRASFYNIIGFRDMLNANDEAIWQLISSTSKNGQNISKAEIYADGTLGGRFTAAGGWTTENGKLPGLFGNTVDMPEHLVIQMPPEITTTTLPNGIADTAYNQALATTGTQPITWSVISGSLPAGLTLSTAGVISGTPRAVGTFNFTVQAVNSVGNDTKPLSIVINGVAPVITTTTLPAGTIGIVYSKQLTVSGTVPITWSLVNGNLPIGLTLSAEGLISGTPTIANISNFTIKAENSAGSDIKTLSITIITATEAPVITTTTLPSGFVDTSYSEQLAATGTTPIIWSLESGNLPNGLTLYGSGTISGTPTVEGTFYFTVQAINSAGNATKVLTVTIEDGVSVSENEISDIRIYPNPTTGKLKIENGELRIEDIVIFDISGRKQKIEREKGERKVLIDISELPVGVYFLRIKTEQGKVVKKVVKE